LKEIDFFEKTLSFEVSGIFFEAIDGNGYVISKPCKDLFRIAYSNLNAHSKAFQNTKCEVTGYFDTFQVTMNYQNVEGGRKMAEWFD